ncbi:MAG TPA: DUF2937 family protein [Beijerinckiaceae bacterium]|nr:DUF2937 family protein [Beijerinckiaceae bacterium]
MWFRRIAVALALLCAAAASQEPEFAQQYQQRLGGAIDALQRVLADFDQNGAQQGLTRQGEIARLKADSDPLAQGGGFEIERIAARKKRLSAQLREMEESGPFGQAMALFGGFDPSVASRAAQNFKPALPMTTSGLVAAAIGFLLGLGLVHGAAWPIRRRHRLARERRLAA